MLRNEVERSLLRDVPLVNRSGIRPWMTTVAVVLMTVGLTAVIGSGLMAPHPAQVHPQSAGLKVQSAAYWATLAQKEAASCLANTTDVNQSVEGGYLYVTTMLKHFASPPPATCSGQANYGAIVLIRDNATQYVLSLLLENNVDASGNLTFQSMDAYYIPIVNTTISSMVGYSIYCPHPSAQACTITQLGAGPTTPNPLCSMSSSFGFGRVGSHFTMNDCATQALGNGMIFIGGLLGLAGIGSGGVATAIGAAIAVTGAYIKWIDSMGGNNGDWIGLGITHACWWIWWTYVCITIITPYFFWYYNPVWTPWY